MTPPANRSTRLPAEAATTSPHAGHAIQDAVLLVMPEPAPGHIVAPADAPGEEANPITGTGARQMAARREGAGRPLKRGRPHPQDRVKVPAVPGRTCSTGTSWWPQDHRVSQTVRSRRQVGLLSAAAEGIRCRPRTRPAPTAARARLPDRLIGVPCAAYLERAVGLLAFSDGDSVCDIACGPGYNISRFVRAVGSGGL
jgi:hypothetical protein